MYLDEIDMGNGASAADWAGTAMTAAKLAVKHLDHSRLLGVPEDVSGSLQIARDYLTQASEELDEILAEVACH